MNGLLNHIIFNEYERSGRDVVEGVFFINLTAAGEQIDSINLNVLDVLDQQYIPRNNLVNRILENRNISQEAQQNFQNYTEELKHDAFGSLYR